MAPSRAESTIAAYCRRTDQLRRQAAAIFGQSNPCLVSPLCLVDYLLSRKEASISLGATMSMMRPDAAVLRKLSRRAISRSTWRQYKSALLYALERDRQMTVDGVVAEELDVAIRVLRQESQSGCLKRSTRTSARKQKSFAASDFDSITAYLESRIGLHKYASALLTWLRASRIAGVRPSEWSSADLIDIDGAPALRVFNAKNTNGRGNGPYRTLELWGAAEETVSHVNDMLCMLGKVKQEPNFAFERHYRQVSDYMRETVRRCLGKRSKYPTLYSLRHQFAADAKAAGCTKVEVAALMGHGVDVTATEHYGRKASGRGPLKVAPVLAELASVRQAAKAGRRHGPNSPEML